MAMPLAAKCAVFIATAISFSSSQSNVIQVLIDRNANGKKPLNSTCKVNQTLRIILPHSYGDNINWSHNIILENRCQLTFEKLHLRTSGLQCFDQIIAAFSRSKGFSACCLHDLSEYPYFIVKRGHMVAQTSEKVSILALTVQTGARNLFFGFLRSLFDVLLKTDYSEFGFVLTLEGVLSSFNASMGPTTTTFLDLGDISDPDNGENGTVNAKRQRVTPSSSSKDTSKSNIEEPDCGIFKELAANSEQIISNVSGQAFVNCEGNLLLKVTKNIDRITVQKVLDAINGLECKAWCGIAAPFVTDDTVAYLNDTHALVAYGVNGETALLLSCTPDSGKWSNLPPCQGFTSNSSKSVSGKEERDNVVWIGLGSAAFLLVAVIAFILIYMAVRRRLHSVSKTTRPSFSSKPDEQIAMEDNPIYG